MIVDKHSMRYHALLAYVKKGLHSTSFTQLQKSLEKKGWPKEWIKAAHKDIVSKTMVDSSENDLEEGEELLSSIKKRLTTHAHLGKHKQSSHSKKSITKKKKLKSHKLHQSPAFTHHLHLTSDDPANLDYAEKLLRRSSSEREHHFYNKAHVQSNKNSSTASPEATKENFDALHEAIKLAQSVIKAQGSIPIQVRASPFQAPPIQPQVQAAAPQSPVAAATQAAETASEPVKVDEQAAEERRILEEERKALQREREQLLEERKRMNERPTSKTAKRHKESISVEENKGDDNAKYLESKLQLLEERLKNADFAEAGKPKEFRNEIEFEDIELASEPVGDRAQTGIIGLDPVIQGGFRRLSTTVVAGGPGSGKTIFAMQYLLNGIKQFNENGVFITFEQSKEDLYALFKNFGWDLEELEKEKKLSILRFTPEQIAKIIDSGGGSLRDSVDAVHGRRIVVDSISDLLMLYHGDMSKRRACVDLFEMFQKLKTTTLVVAEQEVNPLKHISNVLEYQVDGVILLYNERVGDIRQRALEIFKMRGTKHAGRIFPIKITDAGVVINSTAAIKQG